MADWPSSSPNITGISTETAPNDVSVGGPAKITELAGEVTAIGADLYSAKDATGHGTFTALIAALWSAISGKASSGHNHDGTYATSGHNHSGVYDPAGSASAAQTAAATDATTKANAAQAAAVQRANHTGTQTASTISDFDTAVRLNRLDQLAAPTGPVALGSQKITGLATPTAPTDAVTKAYADSLPTGSSSFSLNYVHVDDYGAVADGATNYLGSVTSGSTTFSATGIGNFQDKPWRSDDVGKTIRIGTFDHHAGFAPFTRTITAVAAGGGSCTLSSAAPWTSQYAVADWGTSQDNAAAIQDAIDDADGRIVLLGPGVYMTDSTVILRESTKIKGTRGAQADSVQPTSSPHRTNMRSMIMARIGTDFSTLRNDYSTMTNGVALDDFQIRGSVLTSTTTAALGAIYATGGNYSTNWYIRNVLCEGGYNAFVAVWAAQMWIENSVFFWSKGPAAEYAESPDNWMTNCGLGSDWRNQGTAMYADANSGNHHIMGTAFQFSRYGLVVASGGNQIIGNRFADSADTGCIISGSGNMVSSNMAYQIPGVTSGYSIGDRCGIKVTGSQNTLVGNSAVGTMTTSTWVTGNNNKILTGASSGATTNTGTGNTIL